MVGFAWEKVNHFTPEKKVNLLKKTRKGCILEVDVEYPKGLHKKHITLPFLAERMKIGEVENLVPNLKDKKTYAVHIRNLKQALKYAWRLEKVHRFIRFERGHSLDEALYHAEYQAKKSWIE